ncbi:hypothetical protein [Clostridium saccharobutylicum]|uniref:Uncharacterized protein n=1 Tax=Clostridium saccharobutylicum DSM 13864 TaxID=1345695 RepID=U5MQH0_CLOSA|nr:hypothetical protein [Clostridium saccharobutylicum]AGX41682.1 hypothetical protein CLSA_c06690 [Clostridium saccharobutylicum DSM 13864]AQR88965.1 hypothetical protein CLOSC_06610 [Clostridium saccharobutylicum]AQR98866.1 hypothetical protein CSACC_06680 [Clostridium saccharobutylicum]AQS08584.1 hypothetical protein CLOBY_06940 [Clostridium saccharobutylicum]AQS12854.1 hypothetical protein CLOSACC_06680 [Clostridium saccharobutylicum]
MFFITVIGSLILSTAVLGIINKKLKFISLSSKKAAIVWAICFFISMIVISIATSLIHGVLSIILLAIKIAPIVLVIYGVYYIIKKLNNTGTNIE